MRRSEAIEAVAVNNGGWGAAVRSGARRRAGLALAALVCGSVGAAIVPASALATLWVSSSGTDTGYCSQANPCATLSRAISLAIPNDTIYMGPGTFTDHVTITPSISGLTIEGAGMHTTTVSGGLTPGSVFTIPDGTTAILLDMSITGGQAPDGGGVNTAGNLTMQDDEVAFNAATGSSPDGIGGGVYNNTGTLTLTDSAIVSNQASSAGGGVASSLSTTVTRDLIYENSVVNASGFAGGIYTFDGSLNQDTIIGNQVVDAAGDPAGYGGGVWGYRANLTSDTIAGNTAASGGGVDNPGDGASGSIFAGNIGGNCTVPFEAGTDNLEDDTADSCGLAADPSNLVGVDPMLASPADNGGPTETMAISPSSPAYDASSFCNATDQRGVSQLQLGATRCDMGAYQVSAPTTYVANPQAGSVTAYATGAAGNAAPVLSLTGPATGLSQPTGVVVDVTGQVFVANTGTNSITEYAPEVTGNATPTATIAGTLTRLSKPQDVALDNAGHLFVTNIGSITEYAPGARGNVAPIARITGIKTQLDHPNGVVIDPDGNLRVTNSNGRVNTYSAQANGNVAPSSQVTHGSSNRLTDARGLNFDAAGQLVVADAGAHRVDTFDVGASGAARPLSVLTGGSPALTTPIGLDLDETGDIFVADSANNSVNEFSPGISGAAPPIASIVGANTGLVAPAFLSELPPPPAPRLRVTAAKRLTRKRLLRDGIVVRLKASGSLAFRSEPVTVSAAAWVHHRRLARAKAAALRPGKASLRLLDTKSARRLLRRHHKTAIKVTITVRGGFGARRHRLTITY